ncbi:MAG: hypothetical protein QOD26_3725 [Betaproteobacteria bacterium]|nr:hypothetical protein [Betaproteobacteria bacterium]
MVLGVVALVGVLAYNYVQERSARREAERSFTSRHPDVLLPEPEVRREPTLEPVHRRPEPQAGATPDPLVDYVIEMALPPGASLKEGWAVIDHRFGRRALLAIEDSVARAGLQMVTREGVVSEAELLEFRSEVETLAAKVAATVRAPEMRPALEAAQELDRACADADVQVALHVVGIPGAEAPAGEHPFHVSRREDGLTLTLDVARTLEPGRGYEAMVRAGRHAAAGGGRLVDDNGAALDDRALATIGAQLEVVRGELAGRGIEPGSPLALRLFS